MARFVVLLYAISSNATSVNNARLYMVTKQMRDIENISPTHGGLVQHIIISRAIYQGSDIWSQATTPMLLSLEPDKLGWEMSKNDTWEPV